MLHIFCSTRLLHYFLQEVGPPTKRMVLMFSFTFWPPHTEVRALPFPAVPSFWVALSWLCLLIHSHGLLTPSFLGPFVLRASGLYTISKNPLLNSLSSLRVLFPLGSCLIVYKALPGPSFLQIPPLLVTCHWLVCLKILECTRIFAASSPCQRIHCFKYSSSFFAWLRACLSRDVLFSQRPL